MYFSAAIRSQSTVLLGLWLSLPYASIAHGTARGGGCDKPIAGQPNYISPQGEGRGGATQRRMEYLGHQAIRTSANQGI